MHAAREHEGWVEWRACLACVGGPPRRARRMLAGCAGEGGGGVAYARMRGFAVPPAGPEPAVRTVRCFAFPRWCGVGTAFDRGRGGFGLVGTPPPPEVPYMFCGYPDCVSGSVCCARGEELVCALACVCGWVGRMMLGVLLGVAGSGGMKVLLRAACGRFH